MREEIKKALGKRVGWKAEVKSEEEQGNAGHY